MASGALTSDTIKIRGNGGDEIDAYYARPQGEGPFPGVVVIQHVYGVDEWIQEVCRRLAHHGYAAMAPHLYSRLGEIGPGTVQEVVEQVRSKGGITDDSAMGDIKGAADALRSFPEANGKVGTIGFCSGGRHAYLAACRIPELDAAVDCWGGGVAPDPAQPAPPGVAPVDLTADMQVPLLGIFGNDDARPNPDEVNRTEEALKSHNKNYEFHRYDGAAHAFFSWSSAASRPEQANDAWGKVWAFFEKYLQEPVAAGQRGRASGA